MRKLLTRNLLRWLLVAAAVLALPRTLIGQQAPTTPPADQRPERQRSERPEQLASLEALPEAPEMAGPSPSLRPVSPVAMPAMAIVATTVVPRGAVEHHFWDRENTFLFATTAGFATADFFVTRANLANGGRELNPLTRPFAGSTPALAANFAAETAGVMGISYVFHKTGHHRLERLTSFVDISGSATAVAYGLAHR